MHETELKSVVPDVAATRGLIEAAGGLLLFEGRMIDLRYGDLAGRLAADDHVVRLRSYEQPDKVEAFLDWKGPTRYEGGYKVREELSTRVESPETMARILGKMGLEVIRDIEREVIQYDLDGAVLRFEIYPRMDVLLEVEGSPEAIERAILITGLPRSGFTDERLPAFIFRFEARTGERAALSRRELEGSYIYRAEDS